MKRYTLSLLVIFALAIFVSSIAVAGDSPVVPDGWTRAQSNPNYAFQEVWMRTGAYYTVFLKLLNLTTGEIKDVANGLYADFFIYDVSPGNNPVVIHGIATSFYDPIGLPLHSTFVRRVANLSEMLIIEGDPQSIYFNNDETAVITTSIKRVMVNLRTLKIIDGINHPPEFVNLSNRGAVIGRRLEFKVEAKDPDDPDASEGRLICSARGLPPGAGFDPQTQIFSWVPLESDKGNYEVIFTVSDGELTAEQTVTISTLYIEEREIAPLYPLSQYRPDIYDNTVVWYDNRDVDTNIFSYDLSTGEETRITDGSCYHITPAVYKDKIVWSDGRNGAVDDIYMYDLSTGQETPIACGPSYQITPAIYGNVIVWDDYLGPNHDIYMYNLATNEKLQITTDPNRQIDPDIYGDTVVWYDDRNGNTDIYMYDIPAKKETRLTDDPNFQGYPAVYDNTIVWEDWRNGNKDIYMYNILTKEETRITGDSGDQTAPAVYNDKIVWTDYRNGYENTDIYMYDLSAKRLIQITENPAWQRLPAIYEDKIVWEDGRDEKCQPAIFMARFFFIPEIISVSPAQLYMGSLVIIKGDNFGSPHKDSQVLFGNGVAASVESWSDTEIVCRVPKEARSGLLKVKTPGGESNGIAVTVLTNNPPILKLTGDKTIKEGGLLKFVVSAVDPDGDNLNQLYATGLPPGAKFTLLPRIMIYPNPSIAGQFTWAPTYDQAGSYKVTFTASDGSLAASRTITITVKNVNRPPVLGPIGGKTVKKNNRLVFKLTANDPDQYDKGQLVYRANNLPKGAVLDRKTGIFSWIPRANQRGTYTVRFYVMDTRGATDSEIVKISVR